MADLQDPPSDSERNDLEARVRAAAGAGRISAADRDIRLGNVRSAQSRTELELMRRDLDQLDATMAPTAPAAPYSTFDPAEAGKGPTVEVSGNPRAALVVVAVVVVVLGVVGAFVAVISHRTSSSTAPPVLPPAQSSSADPADTETSPPGSTPNTGPGVPAYSQSAAGIRSFLTTYEKKFGTTRVVDLVMYPTYVVVDVPVAGGQGRQQGWLYRQGSGWTGFGGVRAVFPGSSTVDTRQLDVDALVRNIRRARATLKVDEPAQSYVIVRFIPRIDAVPSVDIHVANSFQESGYLATTLDGKVERAYPFGG